MKWLIFMLLSYLLGSLPTAYLVGKYIGGFDIRRRGSGNVGATNAFRTMGPAPGLAVLLVDVFKGLIPVLVGKALGGPGMAAWGGLAAMAGHNWSVFLQFQGGRGVATAAGAVLAMSPAVLFWALLIWLAAVVISRYVSLGSIAAAAAAPLLMLLFRQAPAYILFSLASAALVIYRHRPNIRRLLAGTEPKIGERR
ncbi:MAG: acyl phosphate:glycerol-3-phosphate acyltransferase [Clostridia bacterium]|nr:acyl phosphate:glycerol-3-phosphate acyltransferase [Clostridia bacterium]